MRGGPTIRTTPCKRRSRSVHCPSSVAAAAMREPEPTREVGQCECGHPVTHHSGIGCHANACWCRINRAVLDATPPSAPAGEGRWVQDRYSDGTYARSESFVGQAQSPGAAVDGEGTSGRDCRAGSLHSGSRKAQTTPDTTTDNASGGEHGTNPPLTVRLHPDDLRALVEAIRPLRPNTGPR